MECRWSIDRVSIECQSRVLIEGINQNLTADTFSTHDLENVGPDCKTECCHMVFFVGGTT